MRRSIVSLEANHLLQQWVIGKPVVQRQSVAHRSPAHRFDVDSIDDGRNFIMSSWLKKFEKKERNGRLPRQDTRKRNVVNRKQ